jgi:hypothetical protein
LCRNVGSIAVAQDRLDLFRASGPSGATCVPGTPLCRSRCQRLRRESARKAITRRCHCAARTSQTRVRTARKPTDVARERSVAGNSWWTFQRIGSGRAGSTEQASQMGKLGAVGSSTRRSDRQAQAHRRRNQSAPARLEKFRLGGPVRCPRRPYLARFESDCWPMLTRSRTPMLPRPHRLSRFMGCFP